MNEATEAARRPSVLDCVDQLHQRLQVITDPNGVPLEVRLDGLPLAAAGKHPAGGFYAGRAHRPYLVCGEELDDIARDVLILHLVEAEVDRKWRQSLRAGLDTARASLRAEEELAAAVTTVRPWLRGNLVAQAG